MRSNLLVRRLAAGLWLSGALLASSAVVFASEVYKATLVSPRGVREDKRAELTLTIEQLGTEEDTARLQKILEEQGSDALIQALRQMEKGKAHVEGAPPYKIHHVRAHPAENGLRIIIVTEKPLYFPEDTPDPRSRDLLGFIQLDVSKEGKGRGTAAEVMKVRFEDGVLQLEGYTTTPIQLENVRRER